MAYSRLVLEQQYACSLYRYGERSKPILIIIMSIEIFLHEIKILYSIIICWEKRMCMLIFILTTHSAKINRVRMLKKYSLAMTSP